MTYYDREDQFLRQRLQKEIPILTALCGTGSEISFEWSKRTGDFWV